MSTLPQCRHDDTQLQRWTFLRYVVLSAIMFMRALKIKENGRKEAGPDKEPYSLHPKLTRRMNQSDLKGASLGFFLGMFYAGCIFVQSEGIGLAIYFLVSALMDNFTIFLVSSVEFCQCDMAVALYSMASVTFLPNCIAAYYLQGAWYDQGKWLGMKTMFVFVMVVITVASFLVRLLLVYDLGWAHWVKSMLERTDYKVVFAVLTPPVVDGIQSLLLVLSSLKAHVGQPSAEQGFVELNAES